MDYSWAVPGAKVVCIKDGKWSGRPITRVPFKGEVLTIREVYTSAFYGGAFLRFNEFVSEKNYTGIEYGYAAMRFRPLITRTQRQDATMFRQLIGKMSPEERALALLLDDLDAER